MPYCTGMGPVVCVRHSTLSLYMHACSTAVGACDTTVNCIWPMNKTAVQSCNAVTPL